MCSSDLAIRTTTRTAVTKTASSQKKRSIYELAVLVTAVRVVVRMADVSAVALLVDVLVAATVAGWSGAFVVYRCVLA